MSSQLNICFASELPEVKKALHSVLNFLKSESPSMSDEDLSEFRLIFSELLANAVIHGNKADSSKKVQLGVELNQHTVWSVIKDEGTGFDYTNALASIESPGGIFDESGRGIKLVVCLTDALIFNETGNEIKFCKKVR